MLIRGDEHRSAIIAQDGSSISYGGITELSKQFASLNLPHSTVLVIADNSLSSLSTIVALIEAQAVPILFNAKSEDGVLIQIIEKYNVEYVFGLSSQVHRLGEMHIVHESNSGYGLFSTKVPRELVQPNPALAILLTTSGSTGSPKLVRISKSNLITNADAIVEYLGITEHERPLLHLPVSYTYGLSILTSHLRVGATVFCTDESIVSRPFWEFVKQSRCTSIPGVPFTYSMLKQMRFTQMGLSDVRTLTQAGGKLSGELQKEFAEWALEKNARFVVMYGQTEATARMSYVPADRALEKIGSIGIPIAQGQFQLLDEKNREVTEPHVVANLIYRGPNVAMGYAFSDLDLVRGDDFNGYLNTGDLAYRDEENYFYLVGRSDRHIKVYGFRINLDDVERIVSSMNVQCACVGKEDQVTIFLYGESNPNENDIRRKVSQLLNLNIKAFSVKTLLTVPLNINGKIDYRKLLEFI
jgi:acyl-coenzyme A synthetase/AMP-(fatty) acid ligase